MNTARQLLMVTAIGLGSATAASAQDYRMTTYAPPNEAASIHQTYIAEQLCERTGGELCFEIFYASSLVPAAGQLAAIGDGVAHAGFQAAGYIPSELPLNNALTAYGFLETNATAIGMAFADWGMHNERALAQYEENNVVPFGGFSTPVYPFICNTPDPITSLDQFQGLKVRFPGGANALLTEHLGGVAVNVPGNELYQALQTGVIDCAGILAGFLNIDNSLQEVATSVTLANFTGSYNSAVHLANLDFWRGLTDEQRAIYLEVTARASAMMQIHFNTNNDQAIETAREYGIEFVELDDEFQAAVQEWVDNGVGDMAGIATEVYGIQDPEAFFAEFQPYVDEWHELINSMTDVNDVDELTALIEEHMYGDLDPSTYMME
ncbi:hypothetical protein HKCCE2091_00150 [Rhodobacterales bacterium HKCCE2091]|nr:hypothetical protein [Rhodobacterales bacterium HKCCE2091]